MVSRGPAIHVKLALADMNLDGAADLVKPAILYADRVTVYSPAATLIRSVEHLSSLSDPREQLLTVLEIARDVPVIQDQLSVDPGTLEQFKQFLALDPAVLRFAARAMGGGTEIDDLYAQLDQFAENFRDAMGPAVATSVATVGGEELLTSVRDGLVEIAEISTRAPNEHVASVPRAATGSAVDSDTDEVLQGWMARVVEMLVDARSFPLLDAQSSDLIRALEREQGLPTSEVAMRRGSEVAAAADFMAFLPYFRRLSMDELVDLRRELQAPLVRFRSALQTISSQFATRPFDEAFHAEVEDAWRREVDPALVDIREALAEHRLLRETASVALGDIRRLAAEAGGVFVAAGTQTIKLSHLVAAAGTVGLPVLDVLGRAINEARAGRQGARQNSFYFLHKVSEEAARHA